MKKLLLMLGAVFFLSLYSCTDKTATKQEVGNGTETEATEALVPTGDAEKDAQACVDYLVKIIEETDFTNEESQKKLEESIKSTQEKFETFYNNQGEEASKAFEEAGKKATEKVHLDELITKKAMEALDAAKDKLKETQK